MALRLSRVDNVLAARRLTRCLGDRRAVANEKFAVTGRRLRKMPVEPALLKRPT
jgi:hypothetical protein